VFKEGREGNDGNSVDKRETEVRYFESGRILFWIHDTVQRGGTWICILLFKCSFTSALYSEDNPPHTTLSSASMFLLNSRKIEKKKTIRRLDYCSQK
jgi:hypothetical protein